MNASKQIEAMIRETGDWRGALLTKIRKLLLDADPEIVEEWKYRGTPTYSKNGLICVMNPHKDKVKITFNYGAQLEDSNKLFNAGLEGNKWRAIDLFEDDKLDDRALKTLIKEALAYDATLKTKSAAGKAKPKPRKAK